MMLVCDNQHVDVCRNANINSMNHKYCSTNSGISQETELEKNTLYSSENNLHSGSTSFTKCANLLHNPLPELAEVSHHDHHNYPLSIVNYKLPMNNTTPKKSNEIENSKIFKSSTFSSTKLNLQIIESSLLTLSSTGGGACQDISAVGRKQLSSTVIPQNKMSRRRNEPCELVYAESSVRRSQSPLKYNYTLNQEITDSRFHGAPRSVSRVQSGFRDDRKGALSTFSSAKPTRLLTFNCILLLCLFFSVNAFAQWSGSGAGTECDPYLITSKADLEALATNVNAGNTYSGIYFKVTTNITTAVTTVIGNSSNPFCGNFDGGSNTIKLGINGSSGDYTLKALFGYIGSDANIHDVTTSGSINGEYVGGIVGEIVSYSSSVTISNCNNGATLNAMGSGCGGILCRVYYSSNVTITNCVNVAAITSNWNHIGGIVGLISSSDEVKIKHCRNRGTVTVGSGWSGGVCGECVSNTIATSEIYDCVNESSATIISNPSSSTCDIGGIAGRVVGFVIDKCANYALVQCGKIYNVGGIVGQLNNAIIRNSFNSGNVSSTLEGNWVSNGIGGVAGCVSLDASTYIYNCYNIGNVTSTSTDLFCGGGVVGYLSGGNIRNCYNGGNLSFHASSTITGNVAGRLYSGANLQYCYFRSGMVSDRCVGDQGSATVSNNSSFSHAMSPMTEQCKTTTDVSGIAANTDLVGALNYWRTNISGNSSLYTEWVDDASPWENLGMPKFKACTPITITTFNVTPGSEQNTLAWEASGTASSYTIYWECPSSIINSVSGNSYSHTGLTAGNTYCYEVMAVGSGDYCAENAHSTRICRTVPTCIHPAVENFAVTQPDAKGRKLQVSWTPETNITYKLYYGVNNPALGLGGLYEVPGTVTPAYTVERLTNGQPYFFVLKPIGGNYCDGTVVYPSTVTPQCNE